MSQAKKKKRDTAEPRLGSVVNLIHNKTKTPLGTKTKEFNILDPWQSYFGSQQQSSRGPAQHQAPLDREKPKPKASPGRTQTQLNPDQEKVNRE